MPVSRLLLTPLSWLWQAVTRARIAKALPVECGVPVICVGNLTMGGTGKTPVVRALVQNLSGRGLRAAALSRGHGGRLVGPLQVDPTRHTSAEVGDEPLMLATSGSIWISRDRPAGALAAVRSGEQVLVMDDGHQNPSLRKTLSLVVVDGETRNEEWPFGDGAVFPAGPMRESFKLGLARADAVVILMPSDLQTPDPELLALFADKPVLIARLQPVVSPPAGPQIGFAGVGKPWKVERPLQAAGCDLVEFVPFADHQTFDQVSIDQLMRLAADHKAGLVTTEKDWVRLPQDVRPKVTSWPVAAVFEDPAALDALLDAALGGVQR